MTRDRSGWEFFDIETYTMVHGDLETNGKAARGHVKGVSPMGDGTVGIWVKELSGIKVNETIWDGTDQQAQIGDLVSWTRVDQPQSMLHDLTNHSHRK